MKLRLLQLLSLIALCLTATTCCFAQIAVNSINPVNGKPGSLVTINGSGFGTTIADNVVRFGATNGIIQSASNTQLIVAVPLGASYAPIEVLNKQSHLLARSNQFFLPTFPPGTPIMQAADFSVDKTFAVSSGPMGLTVSDLDGDGLPDLAVATTISDVITVRRNTTVGGNLSFAPIQNFIAGRTPYAVAAGDLDGDGLPDLVAANGNSNTITLFRNTSTPGNISFVRGEINIGYSSDGIAISDYDGDGKADIAVVHENAAVAVLRNTSSVGNLSFANKIDFAVGWVASAIAAGDLDGDGKTDIVTGDFSGSVSILKNNSTPGTIVFAPRLSLPVGGTPQSVTIGDYDGDGKLDIATPSVGSTSIIRNLSSPGTINMAPEVEAPGDGLAFSIASADIDGDGKLDLATANWYRVSSSRTISLLKNNSALNNIILQAKVNLTAGRGVYGIALNDLDGDGLTDAIVTNNNDQSVTVFLNRPSPIILRPSIQATSLNFTSITPTSTTIKWTNGDGISRMVFIKADQNNDLPNPIDGTQYAANSIYATGAQLGSSGWYAIYNGTGSQASVTGLQPNTKYQVMVCEMTGLPGNELYLNTTATGNPAGFTTTSDDATLSSLSLGAISFNPRFSASTYNYATTVPYEQANIMVTPTTNVAGATVKVNNTTVASGSVSQAIPLNVGLNNITIVVTALDGLTTKTYRIQIIRNKAEQVITFNSIPAKSTCDADFNAGATSSSNLPITYSSNNTTVATVTPAGLIHIVGAGTAVITANQFGNNIYDPASPKSQTLTVTGLSTPTINITSSATGAICDGNQVVFTAFAANAGNQATYQWVLNNVNVGSNQATFTTTSLKDGDQVKCVLMTSGSACISPATISSNTIRTSVAAPANLSLTIQATGNPVKAGTSVVFRASATGASAGTQLSYQWKVNGIAQGTNSDTFVFSPVQGDKVTCELTTNIPCTAPVSSNQIVMAILPETPSVVITSSVTGPVCPGSPISFVASVSNAGSQVSYQWLVNNMPVGTNQSTFVSSTLKDGDRVSCTIATSSETASSNTIRTSVAAPANLLLTIQATGNPVKAGTSVIFKATAIGANAGAQLSYQWKVNGIAQGTNSDTFVFSPVQGDKVTCELTTNIPCTAPVSSNQIVMAILPETPSVVITSSVTGPVCPGSPISFVASVSNAGSQVSYQWLVNNMPVGTNQFTFVSSTLKDGDRVSCTIATGSATASSNTIRTSVAAPANLLLTIQATANPVKAGTSVIFKATAIGANAGAQLSYQWKVNGIAQGTNSDTFIFNPIHGDKVTCELSTNMPCTTPVLSNQIVMAILENNKITVPAAFSPNGDGINDYWQVNVGKEKIVVSVFNRNGLMVYESKDYDNTWDGRYQGKQLAAGTYYYIIQFSRSGQRLSGPLTLIY